MKNLVKLICGLFLISSFLMSCSKDDNETTSKNYFKINDVEYNLSDGILYSWDETYDANNPDYYGYEQALQLWSKDLSLQIDNDGYPSLSGKGLIVDFEMFSTTKVSLDNGDYTISSTSPYPINSISEGMYSVDFEDIEDCNCTPVSLTNGKITISKSGNDYSISIDCTNEYGDKITGLYKGTLHYIDAMLLK